MTSISNKRRTKMLPSVVPRVAPICFRLFEGVVVEGKDEDEGSNGNNLIDVKL
jgi:hypothetical protein